MLDFLVSVAHMTSDGKSRGFLSMRCRTELQQILRVGAAEV